MTPPKETPASQRRQAEGITGATISEPSVPAWAQRRVEASLLRFRGQYLTPAELHRQAVQEARGGAKPVNRIATEAAGSSILETPGTYPVDQRPTWSRGSPRELSWDSDTGQLLPCRSLVTTQSSGSRKEPAGLVGPHRKVASALAWNVEHLCRQFGVERVGFLTLTFADHVLDVREASRRFNSLSSNVLRKRYAAHIRVLERQKSGRIHYHLLVVLDDDIRTGCDFDAFANRDYKSANNHLRREWAYLRHTAPLFRFGRTELMPIRSDAAAMGQYVGKYIGKHIGQREERDKGARLVSYSGDARMATSKHMRVGKYENQWRAKCLTFSRIVAGWKPHARIQTTDDLAFYLGKRWSYTWRDFILALPAADLEVPF